MIRSFKDKATEAVFEGRAPKGLSTDVARAARRRLAQLHAAASVEEMRTPPGNKLHPLDGDRAGQWAVWINKQYRLCFGWGEQGPEDVEITDYH